MKYVGIDIHTGSIVYTVLSENGELLTKGKINNTIKDINEFLGNFEKGDSFVTESTGFYEPIYDAIDSTGF